MAWSNIAQRIVDATVTKVEGLSPTRDPHHPFRKVDQPVDSLPAVENSHRKFELYWEPKWGWDPATGHYQPANIRRTLVVRIRYMIAAHSSVNAEGWLADEGDEIALAMVHRADFPSVAGVGQLVDRRPTDIQITYPADEKGAASTAIMEIRLDCLYRRERT